MRLYVVLGALACSGRPPTRLPLPPAGIRCAAGQRGSVAERQTSPACPARAPACHPPPPGPAGLARRWRCRGTRHTPAPTTCAPCEMGAWQGLRAALGGRARWLGDAPARFIQPIIKALSALLMFLPPTNPDARPRPRLAAFPPLQPPQVQPGRLHRGAGPAVHQPVGRRRLLQRLAGGHAGGGAGWAGGRGADWAGWGLGLAAWTRHAGSLCFEQLCLPACMLRAVL